MYGFHDDVFALSPEPWNGEEASEEEEDGKSPLYDGGVTVLNLFACASLATMRALTYGCEARAVGEVGGARGGGDGGSASVENGGG